MSSTTLALLLVAVAVAPLLALAAPGEVDMGDEHGEAAAVPRAAASVTGLIGEWMLAFPALGSNSFAAVP